MSSSSTAPFEYVSPWSLKPKGLSKRSKEETESAKTTAVDRAMIGALRTLLKASGNTECADCTSKCPSWGVLPHGVFVCIDCAQLHRHIGKHISQTKNFSTYMWYPDEVDLMHDVGNTRANAVYMARAPASLCKPSQDAAHAVKLEYVRCKYEQQKYLTAEVVGSTASASAKLYRSSAVVSSTSTATPLASNWAQSRPATTAVAAPIAVNKLSGTTLSSNLWNAPASKTVNPSSTDLMWWE